MARALWGLVACAEVAVAGAVRYRVRSIAVLAGVPVLVLGLTAGTVAASGGVGTGTASGAGHVTIYAGIDYPRAITAGPDGALWFTADDSIGRITTSGTKGTTVTITGQNTHPRARPPAAQPSP